MDFVAGPLPGMPPQHAAAYRLALRAADAVIVQNARQQALLAPTLGIDARTGELLTDTQRLAPSLLTVNLGPDSPSREEVW